MPLLIYKTRILSLKDIEARLEPPFGGGGEESVYLLKYSIISRKKKVVFSLAWKTPWMEEPGGLQSMGSGRVRHD